MVLGDSMQFGNNTERCETACRTHNQIDEFPLPGILLKTRIRVPMRPPINYLHLEAAVHSVPNVQRYREEPRRNWVHEGHSGVLERHPVVVLIAVPRRLWPTKSCTRLG